MEKILDFYPRLDIQPEDDNQVFRVVLEDTTVVNPFFTENITSLHLYVSSSYTPIQDYEIDLIPYLTATRVDREWYVLQSDMLGLGESQPFPDGLYDITIQINNTYTTNHKYFIFHEIESKIQELLDEAGFKVDATENNLAYQGSNKYDFETYSILYSLLAAIRTNSLDGKTQAAEQALLKAQRVLSTIEDNDYGII